VVNQPTSLVATATFPATTGHAAAGHRLSGGDGRGATRSGAADPRPRAGNAVPSRARRARAARGGVELGRGVVVATAGEEGRVEGVRGGGAGDGAAEGRRAAAVVLADRVRRRRGTRPRRAHAALPSRYDHCYPLFF
jgi:hypothetical protein